MPREKQTVTSDELEMANMLANEASLGFGDLFSAMYEKSKKSHNGGVTGMSVAEQPPRSRSQSYRDNPGAVPNQAA